MKKSATPVVTLGAKLCDVVGCLHDGTVPTGRYKKIFLCAKCYEERLSASKSDIRYLLQIDELRHRLDMVRHALDVDLGLGARRSAKEANDSREQLVRCLERRAREAPR